MKSNKTPEEKGGVFKSHSETFSTKNGWLKRLKTA